MEQIMPLNEIQINELKIFKTSSKHKPFRLLTNGQAINITTGYLSDKGSNIIYHPVYWDRPKKFINQVLEYVKKNNPGVKFRITYH